MPIENFSLSLNALAKLFYMFLFNPVRFFPSKKEETVEEFKKRTLICLAAAEKVCNLGSFIIV